MREHIFYVLSILFVLISVSLAAFYILKARKSSRLDWFQLVGRLRPIDRNFVNAFASDIIDGNLARLSDTQVLFETLDGMKGLEILDHNCEVIVDLAIYVQAWYPDAMDVAEELRINARELRWHIERLRAASIRGQLLEQFSSYAPRAVVNYYLMTSTIISLYEVVRLPELVELQRLL